MVNELLIKPLTKIVLKIMIDYSSLFILGHESRPEYIKNILKNIFKKNSPAVLYGGSVDGINVKMFKKIKEIDGFLIGGASKSSKKFIDIIKNYYR